MGLSKAVAFITWMASSAAASQPISEHNELQAAIGAGYSVLFEAGCARPTHVRTKRFALTQVGGEYRIEGNHITLNCLDGAVATLKWVAPTAREDGTPLAAGALSRYEISHNGKTTIVDGDVTTATVQLSTGAHTFEFRSVDTGGRYSEAVTVRVD